MTLVLPKKTVVVGMSGGVDSAVSALLLKEQGYHVIGMFMKNWEEKDDQGVCLAQQDFEDVVRVCEKLDIPYYSIEFVKEYWENVFQSFLDDYQKGYTPNPDILCNREIKFNLFYKKALEFGADFLATGHYARKIQVGGKTHLLKGKDPGKDQSYFIYTLKEKTLENVLFPIGNLLKSEVRKIALEQRIPVHAKKDSTGICFIGERNFKNFLSQYVQARSGDFRTLDGAKVGRHAGAVYYTLGQRKGLGLGGEGDAWFVVDKDMGKNTVYVERGTSHSALYSDDLIASELSWVAGFPDQSYPIRCKAKVRYRQPDQDCTIEEIPEASLDSPRKVRVRFDRPQRAITPRQSVVFYQDERCLGGGMIDAPGQSYFQRGIELPRFSLEQPTN